MYLDGFYDADFVLDGGEVEIEASLLDFRADSSHYIH
jgi:hypothetical protein